MRESDGTLCDLRRWKAEAIEVLRKWDAVADTVEIVDPCPLGHSRAEHVLRFVERAIVNTDR